MTTNYTCPECGATVTQEQLSIKGMCPECGCPSSTIYAAQQKKDAQERRENAAKEEAAAGQKALESIINGESHEQAIDTMNSEWAAHCEAHLWD